MVQENQATETHEASPTFQELICWKKNNMEKGTANRPMQSGNMHIAPFIPENLKSTLET